MIDKWYRLPNYEGIYEINKLGQIRRVGSNILRLSPNTSGYLKVTLYKNGSRDYFMVHQLMALTFLEGYVRGSREMVVDHIDNNKLNNSIENLRVISFRLNVSKDKKSRTSKFTGVSWVKARNKWVAYIGINGKNKNLGYFSSEEEASAAYQNELNNLNQYYDRITP